MVISQYCEKTKTAHGKEIRNGCVLANAETQNQFQGTPLLLVTQHRVDAKHTNRTIENTECRKREYTEFG